MMSDWASTNPTDSTAVDIFLMCTAERRGAHGRIALVAWAAAVAAMLVAMQRGGAVDIGRALGWALIVVTGVLIAGGIVRGRFGRIGTRHRRARAARPCDGTIR